MNIGFKYFRSLHRWGVLFFPICVFLIFTIPSQQKQSLAIWLVYWAALGLLLFFGVFVEWPTTAGFSPKKIWWKCRGDPRDHHGIR